MSDKFLQDKVAVVTGAASGIGLAVAERLTAAGAKVVISDIQAEAGRAQVLADRFAAWLFYIATTTAVVTLIAGAIRLVNLDYPKGKIFDEVYYAKAGCVQVTEASEKECLVDSADERYWVENEWDMGSWVHPPLGKLTIGLGIEAFSMSSFGWRITSALAGIGVDFLRRAGTVRAPITGTMK